MLLDIYKNLLKIYYNQSLKAEEKKVHVFKEEELRSMTQTQHSDLLKLLSINLDDPNETSTHISFKPLIRKADKYFFIYSHFENISMERCIDKILSNSHEIIIKTKKGSFFEDQIERFLKEIKIKFSRVSRDEQKGIPEMDGMFVLEDFIFIFEAKAMIKPENIIEANDCFKKINKAFKQIIERINVLLDPNKRRLIEEKTNISFSNKKIAPFILLNHVYFNGFEGLYYSHGEKISHIPIIDFNTLKKLLITGEFPTWKYIKKQNAYKLYSKKYCSSNQLYEYMLTQINALNTSEETIYQLNEDYVLSPIAKSVRVSNS